MEAWAPIGAPTPTASPTPRPPDPGADTGPGADAGPGSSRAGRSGRAGRRLVVAGAGGVLTSLATPPWGWWPLGVLGLAVLAGMVLEGAGAGWRHRWLLGFAWAAGMFAVTLFWMSEFHAVGYAAAFLGYAAFYATAVAVVPATEPGRWTSVAAVPAALIVIEWIRDRFPFGGVPLGSVEIGQVGGPLAPAARLFGGLSLLGLAATLGAAIALVRWAGPRRPAGRAARRAAALAVVGVIAVVGVGRLAPAGHDLAGGAVRIGVVQGGGERGLRAVFTDSTVVFERHREVADGLAPPLDLVVWPENAIDVPALTGSEAARTLAALARRVRATVLAGVTEDADGDRFVNVAYAWSPDGEVVDSYVKVKRVPFGEYVPGRGLFERLVDLSILPRDAVAGSGPGVLRTPAGDYGVSISYEVFFADRARDAVRAGAEVLVVPTNASSFTTSQVPTQQVAAARLRAWETGRWLVQAAPTGYSAVVDPRGRVLARSVLGRAQILEGTVVRRQGRTPYARWGDLPVLAASAAGGAGLWLAPLVGRRRRPRPATGAARLDRTVNF